MCGICGVVSSDAQKEVDEGILRRMNQSLYHRGPDDEGYYTGEGAMLAMRRLSIIDLTTGHQPITNEDKTLWLVFNGEIYNYQKIRAELVRRGHAFSTQSDSEVIIHAYEEYGDQCVEHFNGMFAFAIWDAPNRRLFLARDRLGIKPLYYWSNEHNIVFGSELQSVLRHPDVHKKIDLAALDQFLTLEYIPGPNTIIKGVRKLLPGHRLIFQDSRARIEQYWDIPYHPDTVDENIAAEILADLIKDAVRMQLISDVPLGAFLSGGIDSSSIVAFMSEISPGNVQTFSIGFDDSTYNELSYARAVARHFNTRHYDEVLDPDVTLLVEQIIQNMDEPLGDFSMIPTFLVSRLARQSVKVVLSGDGGDELFGGYDTYVAQQVDRYYRWLPAALRQKALPALSSLVPPQPAKKGLINKTKRLIEGGALPDSLQHTRWMMFMNNGDKARLYQPELRAALNGDAAGDHLKNFFEKAHRWDPLAQQQYVDIKTYLVDDILTKVDRMSMASSLEARVPLLDHRIVEFAVNLPAAMKLQYGQTKIIFRRAMKPYLPEVVLNKPKQGFSIPIKHWLSGSLKPLMMDVLSAECVRRRGYFNPQTISKWIREHLEGRNNHSHRLWALMVFELWDQKSNDG